MHALPTSVVRVSWTVGRKLSWLLGRFSLVLSRQEERLESALRPTGFRGTPRTEPCWPQEVVAAGLDVPLRRVSFLPDDSDVGSARSPRPSRVSRPHCARHVSAGAECVSYSPTRSHNKYRRIVNW